MVSSTKEKLVWESPTVRDTLLQNTAIISITVRHITLVDTRMEFNLSILHYSKETGIFICKVRNMGVRNISPPLQTPLITVDYVSGELHSK